MLDGAMLGKHKLDVRLVLESSDHVRQGRFRAGERHADRNGDFRDRANNALRETTCSSRTKREISVASSAGETIRFGDGS
jgi:hypothetical protein